MLKFNKNINRNKVTKQWKAVELITVFSVKSKDYFFM